MNRPDFSIPCVTALFLISLSATRPCRAETPSAPGDAAIRAPFGGSEIVVATSSRFAGAINSVTWKGREFIDRVDHGRELQSACSFDNTPAANGETFNPTEAGSRDDGAGTRSTSRLLEWTAEKNILRTVTQMAFWLAPGERSQGQLARNAEPLSRHILSKEVRIGGFGLPNALDYTVTFRVPESEPLQTAQFETLTGYMPAEFSRFWRFDRTTGQLAPLSDGPGEINDPVALTTEDGQFAMGIIAMETPSPRALGPTYGRFRFVAEKVVKWNCVFRQRAGVPAGDYRFRMAVLIGTRDNVEESFRKLDAAH